jgi:cardiolipin synthase (CMP-forming)
MFTIPNAISLLRGFGVPLFLWAYLVVGSQTWSLIILMLGGISDYLDGKLARALNQTSAFGEKLDPAIDRLYLAAIILAFSWRGLLPPWVAALLISRDVALAGILLIKRRVLAVTYLGKAATFNLLYALPLLLLNNFAITRILGWSFAIWGVGLYLLTGIGYARMALSEPDLKG